MRYRGYGELDDQPLVDGDEGFIGQVSRVDPDTVEPAMLSYGKNIRLDDSVIRPRKTSRGITSQSDATTMENDNVVDAIRFNDQINPDDQILCAGSTSAYTHTTDENDSLVTIPYPLNYTLTNGFLLQTSVNTILFGDPSPSLNFQIPSNGFRLGNAVLRLRDFVNYNNFTINSQRNALVGDTIVFNKNFSLGQTPIRTGEIATVIGFESSFLYQGTTHTNAPRVRLSSGIEVILPMSSDNSTSGLYPTYWSFVTADSARDFAYFKQQNIRDISVSGTTFTCTTNQDHNFVVGELVKFENSSSDGIYEVVTVTGNQFTFKSSDTQSRSVSSGLTGIVYSIDDQCPSAEFATWAGNRLVVPVGNDDIMISSPLSTHDFPITNRLTIASSDSGNITALEPMQDDSLVAFKDNSVFLVSGIYEMLPRDQGGSLAITRISDQLGCVNKDAVQVVGQEVMFLSRQGLYALTLNAKGDGAIGLPPQAVRVTDLPLSRDIQDVFDKGVLNEGARQGLNFERSQLEFYRGKVYLLSAEDYTQSRRPVEVTQILVYSTLSQRWESVDVYRGGAMKLIPITRTGSRFIMLHSREGLLEIEKHENTFDEYNSELGNEHLLCEFETRGYRSKSFGNKHFRSVTLSWEKSTRETTTSALDSEIFQVTSTAKSPVAVSTVYQRNGDQTEEIGSHFSRFKLRQRGESIKFKFNTRRVRFGVKRIAVEATQGSRQIQEF